MSLSSIARLAGRLGRLIFESDHYVHERADRFEPGFSTYIDHTRSGVMPCYVLMPLF